MPDGIQAIPRAPGGVPLLGHAWPLWRDPYGLLERLEETGPLVRLDLGRMPVVVVTDVDLLHEVLVSKARYFAKGRIFEKMGPLVGAGLATIEGSAHRQRRRLVQPAFHKERLAQYGEVMAARARALRDSWEPGRRLAVEQEMGEYAIATLAETMFSSSRMRQEAVSAVRRDVPIILDTVLASTVAPPALDRLLPANRRFLAAARRLRAVIDEVISDRRDGDQEGTDLLSMLLEARDADTGEVLSDDEVRDELATMLFAGTETTASTFTWLFHELARHPEAEQRLIDELRAVLGGRAPTFADLPNLPVMRQTLDETIRLHGVTLMMRRVREPVSLGGAVLEPGTEIAYSPYALHRSDRVYKDPHRFDPTRFAHDGGRDRRAFTPFGAGARKCIGDAYSWAEITLTMATLLPRWRMEPVPGHVVRPAIAAMARPDSLPMTIRPRQG
ncbi:cytochrome P450 [Streptomyces sp. NPDC007083]|uniref:cytochrome P450 n=1 Tax=Streptomyces sp. NPDC007083 TaxID=3156913 RepID=UPI0033EBD725